MGDSRTEISFDDLVIAVSDIQRRRLLIALRNAGPNAAIDPVAPDSDVLAPDSDTHPASLYHVHLPKLDTQGFISWDRDAGTVRRGPEFNAIEPFLAVLIEYQNVLPRDFLRADRISA